MTTTLAPHWESLRTDESRAVEQFLIGEGFDRADAYRYNPASIRVRVIDPRFEGLSTEERLTLVEAALDRLPEQTQADIITLLAFAPSELSPSAGPSRTLLRNLEFDEPTPSML